MASTSTTTASLLVCSDMIISETLTHTPAETETVAKTFAEEYLATAPAPFVALYGDLGVGKTAFVRGLAQSLAPEADVCSPTYALVNVYRGLRNICHFDMYRIADEDDLYSIGFYDYLDDGSVIVTEWSEKIPYALPPQYYKVTIEKLTYDDSSPEQGDRRIVIELCEA